MDTHYSSFLIRIWRPDDGTQRIKIEHVQSGESTHVSTLTTAIAWISLHRHDATSTEVEQTGKHKPSRLASSSTSATVADTDDDQANESENNGNHNN